MIRKEKKSKLHRSILDWYHSSGRALPWRKTRDPYRILVSEVMLQQTQVSRVREKYPLFLKLFPSITALAKATPRQVIVAWRGMGYNNRAIRLHKLARVVVDQSGGSIVPNIEFLKGLPGVGNYTANALLSFAFRKRVPVVETNIRRVLSRILWRMPATSSLQNEPAVREAAGHILPLRASYEWNQALMDLGATICSPRSPSCQRCPAKPCCSSSGRMSRVHRVSRRPEPSFRGIPNRIYRGRVIEHLREHREGQRIGDLGDVVAPGLKKEDEAWFLSVINSLEKDGLVRVRRRNNSKPTSVVLA